METLREKAARALEAALGFVEKTGNESSRLRVRVLLDIGAVEDALADLATRQRDDGSFAPTGQVLAAPIEAMLVDAQVESPLLGTLEAFSLLTDWKQLHNSQAERAVDFLRAAQEQDGAWGSGGGIDPQPTARIFTAGMLAGFMGRTRFVRPEMQSAVGRYLSPLWSVDRIRRVGWPHLASFAHYYTNVFDDNAEAALPWCGRELLRGQHASEYDTVETMRLLLYCDADVLPGADFEIPTLLQALLEEQQEDGSFAAAIEAPEDRVAATLDAMLGLLWLCRG